jgi:hypothetical protein
VHAERDVRHETEPVDPSRANTAFATLLARLARDQRPRAAPGVDRAGVESGEQRIPQPRAVDRLRQVLWLAAGEEDHRGALQLGSEVLAIGVLARLHGHERASIPAAA